MASRWVQTTMSSTKGGGKSFVAGPANSSSMGKGISGGSRLNVDQLSHNVEDISLDSAQDGGWEVYPKKAKNRSRSHGSKSSAPHNTNAKTWGEPDLVQKFGMKKSGGEKGPGQCRQTPTVDSRRPARKVYFRPQSSSANHTAGQPAIPPPLQQGWNWQAKAAASQSVVEGPGRKGDCPENDPDEDIGETDGEYEPVNDIDDELFSDEFDSDASHTTCKKSKWFKSFFTNLDKLTVEEINELGRKWHCPACGNGPGAIDWFRGLQSLSRHAKMKLSRRVKVHRKLAELLDD